MVRQALRVGMVTVGVAAVWPTALAWAPTATPAPAIVLADAARVEPTADGASAGAARPRRRSGWCRTRGRCRRCSSRTSPAPSSWSRPSRSTRRARCWPRRRWPRRRSPTTPATTRRSSTCAAAKRSGRARRSTPSSRRSPAGVLGEWALVGEAMAAEQASDFPAAAALYETLSKSKPEEPDTVLLGLRPHPGGERQSRACAAGLSRPLLRLSDERRRGRRPDADDRPRRGGGHGRRARAGAGRAALHGAPLRRRPGRVRGAAGAQRRRSRAGRAAHRRVPPLSRSASPGGRRRCSRSCRAPSARPKPASSTSPRRARSAITPATSPPPRRSPADFKTGAWTEETLNNLATHYIVTDDDATAGTVFADYLERFPQGKYGARAAWRLGWWKYRAGDFEGAATIFDQAAVQLPALGLSSELAVLGRPRLRQDQPDAARQRPLRAGPHRLSPLLLRPPGRRASRRRDRRRGRRSAPRRRPRPTRRPPAGLPPNATAIRQLILSGAFPLAEAEVRFAQRRFTRDAGARSDAGLAAAGAGRVPPGHQRDEARLSAVHDAGRRSAAARRQAGDLPARLLAAHRAPCHRPRRSTRI